ncbi:MAG: hypothetical protein NTX87_10695, partial [Planctomycetota bacterium]|nr:hypothetical protein [Planctomycetota bacterium]
MTEAATTSPSAAPPRRTSQPLAPAAAAFIAGILAGEYAGGGMAAWCAAVLVAAAAWLVLHRRGAAERTLLAVLLVVLAAAGAARYRAAVDPPAHDVARFAAGGPRLVTLEGIVIRSPRQTSPPGDVFLPSAPKPAPGLPRRRPGEPGAAAASASPVFVRSTFALDSTRIMADGRWFPAAGEVRVTVREALPTGGRAPVEDSTGRVDLGDRVRILGALVPP